KFDVFLSYARADNQDNLDKKRWVTTLRDTLIEVYRPSYGQLRVFFDEREIRSMDDWQARIAGGLRSSAVLLVVLSPIYLRRRYCLKECTDFGVHVTRRGGGLDNIAVLYAVSVEDVPGKDETDSQNTPEEIEQLKTEILDIPQHQDIRELFPEVFPDDPQLRAELEALSEAIDIRLKRQRRLESLAGNTSYVQALHFCGRKDELLKLHKSVALSPWGTVTVVHGFGGIGKTTLVKQYAHTYHHEYAGAWLVDAEGHTDLLEALAGLVHDHDLKISELTAAEREDNREVGRKVIAALQRCASASGSPNHVLVVLDNVDQWEILASSQLDLLPQDDSIRVVVTSRVAPEQNDVPDVVHPLPLGRLATDEAVAVIESYQPARGALKRHPQFASTAECDAACEIVELVEGFTLTVEQIGLYLVLKDVSPSVFLEELKQHGMVKTEEYFQDRSPTMSVGHPDRWLPVIIDKIWDTLGEDALGQACRMAVELAALLPAEDVVWPWIEQIVDSQFPGTAVDEQFGGVDHRVRRMLISRHWLTQTNQPEVLRCHRLIGEHIRNRTVERDHRVEQLREHLIEVAGRIGGDDAPPVWEVVGLAHAVVADHE
ncbi:toll/interleukin-1 receptor domain-containing protein, partial [Corynebacterium sp. CCM 8864]